MNTRLRINEAVAALVSAEATAVGDSASCFVPAGSVGTVVFVQVDETGAVRYEAEFPVGRKGWGHAVLGSNDLESLSEGRVYVATIANASTGGEGRHVAAVAKDLEEAHQRLEERYGVGSVLTLHNEHDAQGPREIDA